MRITILFFLLLTSSLLWAQQIDKIINVKEVERIEQTLASDAMRGRKTFTPDIDRAADFIANEFKTIGLKSFPGTKNFRQEFAMVRAKFISASGIINDSIVNQKNIIAITCSPLLEINNQSGYEEIVISPSVNLQTEARKLVRANKNLIVWVPTQFANSFGNLSRLKSSLFKTPYNVVFVLTDSKPVQWKIEASHTITEQNMANVIGIIPGRSKANEFVVFSGHYDHLGIGRAINGDSIYNGANDDAAGTTAVIMLANYFQQLNNNERTLIFVAFTAEEVGGFGSQYFSRQMNPDKVMAMFNIEMIGTDSKWGKNSAYITGFEKTDMGEILKKNLEGTGFTFYADPYPEQQLFYRSDNATLARLGVPAHTISTSKMDSEPNYHKVSDEVLTLDLNNMTMIIKAIALSSKSIIAGTATPNRVKVEDLR